MNRVSTVQCDMQCDKGDPPTSSLPQQSSYSNCHLPSTRWHTALRYQYGSAPAMASSLLLLWTGQDWTILDLSLRSTIKPGKLDWLKTVLFLMNPNSYVNLLQLVNMCILNLSEKKKNLRKKEKKKSLVLSCLNFSFWIFVCFCLLLLCIDYYQWITVQKRRSECFPFTHLISRQKKNITFFKTEKSAA